MASLVPTLLDFICRDSAYHSNDCFVNMVGVFIPKFFGRIAHYVYRFLEAIAKGSISAYGIIGSLGSSGQCSRR